MKITEKQIEKILSDQEYYDGDYSDYIIGFERGLRKALTLTNVSKRLNLTEIDSLLDFAYMNVDGNGFSSLKDVNRHKKNWRKRIGYTKKDL